MVSHQGTKPQKVKWGEREDHGTQYSTPLYCVISRDIKLNFYFQEPLSLCASGKRIVEYSAEAAAAASFVAVSDVVILTGMLASSGKFSVSSTLACSSPHLPTLITNPRGLSLEVNGRPTEAKPQRQSSFPTHLPSSSLGMPEHAQFLWLTGLCGLAVFLPVLSYLQLPKQLCKVWYKSLLLWFHSIKISQNIPEVQFSWTFKFPSRSSPSSKSLPLLGHRWSWCVYIWA